MQPLVIPRSAHPISRRDIDPDALKVLYRLYRAGHLSYLVGGSVRDLLVGVKPKDFDVATDAHPQKVRKLFRNCVLIGRRFRLAHVRFGDRVVEVSTFRAAPEREVGPDGEDLLITRDNTFGTPEEDALRRDFTMNALFYDIGTYSIIDYVGGLRDLEDGVVRSIGDAHVRYQEDPVRMIRAAKFAARLSFEIVDEDLEAIAVHRDKLKLASVPRLLEECFKLLRSGHAAAAFKLLHELGLLGYWLPAVATHLDRQHAEEDPEGAAFYRSLFALDDLVAADDRPELTNSLLLSALVLPLIEEELEGPAWEASAEKLEHALERTVRPLLRHFAVSRRDSERLHDVLLLVRKLVQAPGARADTLSRRSDFHEAVAVLVMLASQDDRVAEAAEAWAEIAGETDPVIEERRPRRRRGGVRRRHQERF